MKKELLKDFIAIVDDVLPKEDCDTFINLFEECKKIGVVRTRQEIGHEKSVKDDEAISFYGNHVAEILHPETLHFHEMEYGERMMNAVYKACREFYTKEWSLAPVSTAVGGFTWKIQKTTKGQGYHVWHAESSPENQFRTLVWTVYLSDIDDDAGGETQFLYYPHSCKPKAGRLMIFPAQFTHTHRGNIYWGHNPKYIATGWLYWNTPDALAKKE